MSSEEVRKKLLIYRTKKEISSKINKCSEIVNNVLKPSKQNCSESEEDESFVNESDCQDDEDGKSDKSRKPYFVGLVIFILWAYLYYFFITVEFGTVYLIISGLIGIYLNTSKHSRNKKTSAYSVFNKDFERIDGTLNPEQFDKEIRYGSSAVR